MTTKTVFGLKKGTACGRGSFFNTLNAHEKSGHVCAAIKQKIFCIQKIVYTTRPEGYRESGVIMKDDMKKNLIAMADAIATFFGRNCEVAVHDVSHMESSLIHIAGNVTNRKPGAPATDLLARHLAKYGDKAPDLPPYSSTNAAGTRMKSSLTFIRDKSGRIVAAICFNMDISQQLHAIDMIENMIAVSMEEPNDKSETFSSTLSEASSTLVKDVLAEFGKHPQSLGREEKIELVKKFELAGAFYFKGMVEDVAKMIGISKYTLYSYRKIAKSKM